VQPLRKASSACASAFPSSICASKCIAVEGALGVVSV
jgi:hypothetical protein